MKLKGLPIAVAVVSAKETLSCMTCCRLCVMDCMLPCSKKSFSSVEKTAKFLSQFFRGTKGPNDCVIVKGSASDSDRYMVGRFDGCVGVIKMSIEGTTCD